MKKTTVKLALSVAATGLLMTGGSASGQGVADMMGGMISQIGQSVSGNVGMMALPNDQLSSSMPKLDLTQMIQQSLQAVSSGQRDQFAQGIASQNLSLLQGNNSIPAQVRVQVRDSIMTDRFNSISQAAPNAFRNGIQPMMVQSMISNIRPWEFPSRFKNAMMPNMVNQISQQIKMPQIQYMQENIESNAFPNISGVPAGMVNAVSGQVKQQQMQYMQDNVMNSSFPFNNMMKK